MTTVWIVPPFGVLHCRYVSLGLVEHVPACSSSCMAFCSFWVARPAGRQRVCCCSGAGDGPVRKPFRGEGALIDFLNNLAIMGGLLTVMIREHDGMREDCDRVQGVSKDRKEETQWTKFS